MTAADGGGDLYNTAARAVGILQVKMLVMMIPEWVGWVFYPGYILFLSHFLFFLNREPFFLFSYKKEKRRFFFFVSYFYFWLDFRFSIRISINQLGRKQDMQKRSYSDIVSESYASTIAKRAKSDEYKTPPHTPPQTHRQVLLMSTPPTTHRSTSPARQLIMHNSTPLPSPATDTLKQLIMHNRTPSPSPATDTLKQLIMHNPTASPATTTLRQLLMPPAVTAPTTNANSPGLAATPTRPIQLWSLVMDTAQSAAN